MPITAYAQANTINTPSGWASHDTSKPTHLRLGVHHHPSAQVVVIGGDIDANNVEWVRGCLEDVLIPGGGLVVDFSAVEFLSVASFTALIEFGKRCQRSCVRWALVGSHAVQRMLDLTDQSRGVPAVPSLTEALERVRHIPVQQPTGAPVVPVGLTRC